MNLAVSLDDGATWTPAPQGVRISLANISVPGEDALGQMDFNFTGEGLITDVWVSREEHLDHNIATVSEDYVTLLSGLIEADA
jgi:hypothetical protein